MGADLLAAEAATDAAARLIRAGSRHAASARQRALMLRQRCGHASTPSLDAIGTRSQLTSAEHETALLAAAGRSNQEIADELHLSVRTVGNRLHRVYDKLAVSGRTELDRVLRLEPPTGH